MPSDQRVEGGQGMALGEAWQSPPGPKVAERRGVTSGHGGGGQGWRGLTVWAGGRAAAGDARPTVQQGVM